MHTHAHTHAHTHTHSHTHTHTHAHTHAHTQPPEIPVEDEEWFFGDIDRKLAESKCKVNGDYLVRYSARQNTYVLTCCINNQAKHFVIQQITDVSSVTMCVM